MTFGQIARLNTAYEERAAIREYDGNQKRDDAEREACHEVYGDACPHNPKHKEKTLL